MSTAEANSRWARLFVAMSVVFLIVWQVVTLADFSDDGLVTFAVYGFVLHMVFGKAYSLIPSYFAREPPASIAQQVQLPLTTTGTIMIAITEAGVGPPELAIIGAALWAVGSIVFVSAIVWTLRTNLIGAETGTSRANRQRRQIDRVANGFVPIALLYLLAGSYTTLAAAVGSPLPFGGTFAETAHLLAAGVAALLVFAVGFRLFPRFLVTYPPQSLVGVVLGAGAFGPALIASNLGGGPLFRLGAALEAVAVVGFAVTFLIMFIRSDRRRVGFYGVLAGSLFGVIGVLIGLSFTVGAIQSRFVTLHFRFNVLGFLGLTIIGVAYQFYPPNIGTFPGASDRTALWSIGTIVIGLLLQAGGTLGQIPQLWTLGQAFTLVGTILYAYLLFGLFYQRYWRR